MYYLIHPMYTVSNPTAVPHVYGLEALMSADEHGLGEDMDTEAIPIRTEHDTWVVETDSVDDAETFGAVPPSNLESIDMEPTVRC